MSIETKIDALFGAMEANTLALNAVAAAWNKLAGQAATIHANIASGDTTAIAAGGVEVAKVVAPKPKAEKPAATPAATVTATPAPTAAAPTEVATASRSEVEHRVTLEDVQQAVKTKATVDKPAVIAVLAKYGVKKSSDLKADQFQLALDDLNAIGAEDLS